MLLVHIGYCWKRGGILMAGGHCHQSVITERSAKGSSSMRRHGDMHYLPRDLKELLQSHGTQKVSDEWMIEKQVDN